MKFYIIFYLLVSFMMNISTTYDNALIPGGSTFDEYDITHEAQSLADAMSLEDERSILTQFNRYISTIKDMALFSFQVPGAPAPIQDFLSGLFALMDVIFVLAVIKEAISLVPFV